MHFRRHLHSLGGGVRYGFDRLRETAGGTAAALRMLQSELRYCKLIRKNAPRVVIESNLWSRCVLGGNMMRLIDHVFAYSLAASMFSSGAQPVPNAGALRSAEPIIVPVRKLCERDPLERSQRACIRDNAPRTRLVVTSNEGPLWPRVYCPNFADYYSERYGRCVPR